ncbi:Prominin-1-A [Trichoplax sp. H2]|nr:Prominin-1-A [Trichoplax sp. H2]|eukprot:RDD38784.1 Prominin-1-A [Trichoplax sp. H2]
MAVNLSKAISGVLYFLLLSSTYNYVVQAQTQNYIQPNGVIVWAELPTMPTPQSNPDTTPIVEVVTVYLYKMVKDFIFFLQPNDLPYAQINSVLKGAKVIPSTGSATGFTFNRDTITLLVAQAAEYEAPFWAMAILGIIIGIVLPIVGLIFCICRCQGNCGGELVQRPPKTERYTRFCYSFWLVIFATFILAGGICSIFAVSELLYAYSTGLPTVQKARTDVQSFVDKGKNQIQDIVVTKSNFMLDQVSVRVNGLPTSINDFVCHSNEQTIVNNVKNIQINMAQTSSDIRNIMHQRNRLISLQQEISKTLADARTNITNSIVFCGNACSNFTINVNTAQFSADFSQMQDLTNIKNDIDQLIAAKLATLAAQGCNLVTTSVSSAMTNTKQVANQAITTARIAFTNQYNFFVQITDDTFNPLLSQDTQKDVIEAIGPNGVATSIYHASMIFFIFFGAVIILVSLFLYIGVLLGCIGYKKGVDSRNRTRTSNAGGHMLMAAASILIILGFFFFIISAIMLFAGSNAALICPRIVSLEAFEKTIDNKTAYGEYPLGVLWLKDGNAPVKFSSIVRNCQHNSSLYRTFQPIVDYYNWSVAFDTLQAKIKSLNGQLNKTVDFVNNVNVMPANLRSSLQRYRIDTQMINYASFSNVLQQPMTNGVDLLQLAQQLEDYLKSFTTVPLNNRKPYDLAVASFRAMDAKIKSQIIPDKNQLNANLTALKSISQTSMTTINNTIQTADDGTRRLKVSNNITFYQPVNSARVKINSFTIQYNNYANYTLVNVASPTGLLGNAWNGLTTLGCHRLLDGFNSYWFSIGISEFFFIPVIIMAIKFAKFLRIMKYEYADHHTVAKKSQVAPSNEDIKKHLIEEKSSSRDIEEGLNNAPPEKDDQAEFVELNEVKSKAEEAKNDVEEPKALEVATEVVTVEGAAEYHDQPKEIELKQEHEDSNHTQVGVVKSKLELADEDEKDDVEDVEKKVKFEENKTEEDVTAKQSNDVTKTVDSDVASKSVSKKKRKRRNKKKKSSSSLLQAADDSAVVAGAAVVADDSRPQTAPDQISPRKLNKVGLPTPSNVVDVEAPDERLRSKHDDLPKPVAVVPKEVNHESEDYADHHQIIEYVPPSVPHKPVQQSSIRYIQPQNPHPSTITMRPSPIVQQNQSQQQSVVATSSPPRRIVQPVRTGSSPAIRPVRQMPVTPIGTPVYQQSTAQQHPPPTYSVVTRPINPSAQAQPRIMQQVQRNSPAQFNRYPQGQPVRTVIASPQQAVQEGVIPAQQSQYIATTGSNPAQMLSPVTQVMQPRQQTTPQPVRIMQQQTRPQPVRIMQQQTTPQPVQVLRQHATPQPVQVMQQQAPSQPAQVMQQAPSQMHI